MAEALSQQEQEDLAEVMEQYLGDYNDDFVRECNRPALGEPDDPEGFVAFYTRIGKLYYAFTGRDFFGGHGYISNYTKRVGG